MRLILLSYLLLFTGVQSVENEKTNSFSLGEHIKYKVHYGFVYAGEAIMTVGKDLSIVNEKPCYNVLVEGNSIGMFDFFMKIRDTWGTQIDTVTHVPHHFFMKIAEGKYRKHEVIDFKQEDKEVKVKKYHTKQKFWKPIETHEVPDKIQDIVSSYYYLRTLDFKKMNFGDTISINVFFEDEVFDFNIRYVGIEKVKTKIGSYEALVLSPIMPENSLFDGENSIRVWLSNDKNKIPLKVKANMFVGAVEVDIHEYQPGVN
ncbi:MAG: DUF3108 domain-containing protein [Cyclobacteriaceae bacterium]|nr:DUF3108 domain-containing protein [Cyclobacteriaceae bacterium]